jgi:hypothetical protein
MDHINISHRMPFIHAYKNAGNSVAKALPSFARITSMITRQRLQEYNR